MQAGIGEDHLAKSRTIRFSARLSVLAFGSSLASPAAAQNYQEDVLGFESVAYWSSAAPLSSRTDSSQGFAALGVLPQGWTEIDSVPLSSLGSVGGSFSFDVKLPEFLPWGEVGVVIVLPSQGIYWQELGRSSLIDVAPNAYHTFTFGLPSNVQTALGGLYNDLRVKILVNSPTLSSPLVLDNARFAGSSGSGGSGDIDDAFLSVPLFGNTLYPSVVLGSLTSIRLAQGVEIDGGVVVNLGTDTSHIFEDVISPTIYSAGPVEVFGAQLGGSLFTESVVTFFNGAGVQGALVEERQLGRRESPSLNVRFPSQISNDDLTAPQLDLVPGRYGSLGLKSNQSLTVHSGTYYFTDVMLEPGATVAVDDSNGPVRWIVQDAFTHRAVINAASGDLAEFGVVYLGNNPAFLESPFSGSFLAPQAELTLGGVDTGFDFSGSFYGYRLLVRPNTRIHFVPPYAFGRPRTSSLPATDLRPLGGGPSILNCGPQLQLNDAQTDANGETFYDSISYSNNTCAEPLLFCNAAGEVILAPTEAELNASVNEACDAVGGGSSFGCAIDPFSLGALCNSDADCTNGHVCAQVCATPTCSETTNRCGSYYQSCAGIPAESSNCQAEPIYECAGQRFTGTLDLADTIANTPQQLEAIPASLSIPPEDVVQLQQFVASDQDFCRLPTKPFQSLDIITADDKDEGSDIIGFKFDVLTDFKSNLGMADFFGEGRFSLNGEFGVKGVLKIFGSELDVFSAGVGLGVEPCGFAADLPVRLFGERISINGLIETVGALASGDTNVGLNDIFVTRDDGDLETPDFGSTECNDMFSTRDDKAGNVRRAAFMARNVREFYLQHGASINLCERTNAELGTDFNCLDTDTLTNNIHIADAWEEDFEHKAQDLFTAQTALNAKKQDYSAAVSLNLLDVGDDYTLAAAETSIPVGPVAIVLAAEAHGGWRIAGKVQLGLDYTGQVPFLDTFTQADDGTTLPFDGSKTFVPLDGDLGFFAGPVIAPGVQLTIVMFAGIGIPGISIGVEGQIMVLKVTQPTDLRFNLVRQSMADPRDVEASHWAGEPFDDGPARQVFDWKWGINYGSRVDVEALSGVVNLAARVRVLFVKKTFRKRLFDWTGYQHSFFLAGGDLAGEPGNPLRGDTEFGTYGDPIALSKLPRLTGNEEIVNPDATAVYNGLLGNEPCVVIRDPR
jgi:hypothetical protein